MPRHILCPNCLSSIATTEPEPARSRPPKVLRDYDGERKRLLAALEASEAENHLLRQELDQTMHSSSALPGVDLCTIGDSFREMQQRISQGQHFFCSSADPAVEAMEGMSIEEMQAEMERRLPTKKEAPCSTSPS